MFEQFRYQTRMRMIEEEDSFVCNIYITCGLYDSDQRDSHHLVFLFSPENLSVRFVSRIFI